MAPFHETNGERLAGGSTRGSGFLLKLLCGADSGKKLGDNTVLDSYQQRVPPTHDSRSTLDILALERRRRSVEVRHKYYFLIICLSQKNFGLHKMDERDEN